MFAYKGPRGMLVRGLFDDDDVASLPSQPNASLLWPLRMCDATATEPSCSAAAAPRTEPFVRSSPLLQARTLTDGWLDGVTVVVGTPEILASAISQKAFPLDCVDQLVIDECDVCLRPEPDCSALWRAATTSPRTWQTIAVGATVSDESLAFARSFGLLEDPWMVQFGDPQRLPPAMKHRVIVVVRPRGRALCRAA